MTLKYTGIDIGDTRIRLFGEIEPEGAEQSKTANNDDSTYGAGLAIDMNLKTVSSTYVPNGIAWIKLYLKKSHCVKQVIQFSFGSLNPFLTWTCTNSDYSDCEGDRCIHYTLTVSTEGAVSDLSLTLNCKYGETVKMESYEGNSPA